MTHDQSSFGSASGIIYIVFSLMHHDKPFWILDLGANNHVCSSLKIFTLIHNIKPVYVTLPNDNSICVKQAGYIYFSPSFYLHNVLYSVGIHLNLISISKLCKSLKCLIKFSTYTFVTQYLITKRMIGLGKQIGGLYRL